VSATAAGRRRALRWGARLLALAILVAWAVGRAQGLDESTQATNPLFRWEYLLVRDRTPDELWTRTREHLELTVVPVVLGTVLSAGLAALVLRFRVLQSTVFTLAGALYTIPSLALFGILSTYNSNWTSAVIALTTYTLLIITRNIIAGIDGVPRDALDAADGLGMDRRQRLLTVELPLATPIILTGIRVATVTTVGLVAISRVIQLGGLASYVFDGYNRDYSTLIILGSAAMVVLAVGLDLVLRGIERLLTPWSRRAVGR
jgi:osmoprotectant transport system permease protein